MGWIVNTAVDEVAGVMDYFNSITLFHRHFCVGRRQVCIWIFKRWPFFHFGVSPCQE
jgi:hypothetical protein